MKRPVRIVLGCSLDNNVVCIAGEVLVVEQVAGRCATQCAAKRAPDRGRERQLEALLMRR